MSLLDGLAIRSIVYDKSPVAMTGGFEHIRFRVTGGEITITDPDEIHLILSWMKKADREHLNTENYVRYMVIENCIV